MTNEEFFNTVKGKKIKWDGWDKNNYFIPEKLLDSRLGCMKGKFYEKNKEYCFDFFIAGGFGDNDWSLVEELPKTHLPDWM